MVEDNLIEGSLKYRDGKKWKQRWAVLNKLSPVADVLQLQLYRDSRDRARGATTKASLALTNTLALTTGFTLDKESHTLALICKDLDLVLAFDSRERLLQWNSKLNINLGHEEQFLIQITQVPLKSRILGGPATLHVRDHRFCITNGTPPRLIAAWASADVRRYGVINGRFVWEGGTRCGRGAGVHIAMFDSPHHITRTFDLAARGALTVSQRRTKAQDACGTVQRDAASWLREVKALDLSKLSDTTSLAPSDACHIMSPPGTGHSRSDLSSGTWTMQRRPSCAAHESYITGGSSSSSGSLIGDEPGWWANTWASARGSLWEVAPDTLYDSPKPFAHQSVVSTASPSIAGIQHWCSNSTLRSAQPSFCGSSYTKPSVTSNPLDNYDVPKNRAQLYDTPRKFAFTSEIDGSKRLEHMHGCAHSTRLDTCGRVMGWAEALMCRRQDSAPESVEPVRVNGEGKMPVLDANTGTIIQPNIGCNCLCGTLPRYPSSKTSIIDKPLPSLNISNKTAIYAVVDKSRKSTMHSSLPIQEEHVASDPMANYANVSFKPEPVPSENSGSDSHCNKLGVNADECGSNSNKSPIPNLEGRKSPSNVKKEVHYLIMGPGPPTEETQSQHLFMKEIKSPTLPSRVSSLAHCRAGRSLSLARRHRSPSPTHRRSTSADSRVNEPWDWSLYESPDPTPGGTPLQSPPQSPFRTTSHMGMVVTRGRGRTRTRPLDQCSGSSTASSVSSVPKVTNVPACDSKCAEVSILRRSSSVPGQKSGNRDSASSSDSGVYESPKHSERFLLNHCYHNSLPRGGNKHKHSSCRDVGGNRKRGEKGDTKSSSSGNSDTSDYLDTLSLSSYSSSEYERLFGRASVTTLRPRSGKEYSRLDRSTLEAKSLPSVNAAKGPLDASSG